MRIIKRRQTTIKLAIISTALLFGILCFAGFSDESIKVGAASSGPSPSFTGAPRENSCVLCHSTFDVNSGGGNVTITGMPATYKPGQQIPLTVTANHSGAVVFGFQMTALDNQGRSAGTYTLPTITPQQLQVVNGFVNGNNRSYIEHTIDGISPTNFDTKSWSFIWTAPAQRVGKIGFYAAANGANDNGSTSGDQIYTTSAATLSGSAASNFDSDAKSDVAVFRPSTGTWYSNSAIGGYQARQFGQSGDKIVPGDYDGDGVTDFAVFRPSTGAWYILKSSGSYQVTTFGQNGDVPVSGDYDGDLKTDIAVWRPSNGTWYMLLSSTGSYVVRTFGEMSDKAVQGDYDADGKTDIAVFRPSNGTWYLLKSSGAGTYETIIFGITGDSPVQGDYDGDGKTDLAVFRRSNATWYKLNSQGFSSNVFGQSTDVAVPADYDGDGKTDIAVFRNGTWYISGTAGPSFEVLTFGESGDIPIASGYIPE